ncbi:MBL fold metallo-hydrolase [Neisseria sp. Ec49-e6-T10]|uniref:MBL fold metallo-hydrolase n=1 Tax=Neisseria sp. Ec49-e6-T10 TaxID=3140744 RepID=UPI003EB8D238
MATVLYDDGTHKCVAFTTLVEGEGVQANQFAIIDSGDGVLLDPGGNLTYKNLLAEMATYFLPSHTRYIFASHQDPDIVASVNGWLLITDAKVLIAAEWERFLPHFCSKGMTKGRLIPIPAEGMNVDLGQSNLQIVPAHYLHTVGNFQIYDPISKILFSGDVGASIVTGEEAAGHVVDFQEHLEKNSVYGFHRRYMSSRNACKYWVNMVRQLDIECMVPQHGAHYKGKEMVNTFLDWFENLECGVDLITQDDFKA